MSDRITTQNYEPVGSESQRVDPNNRVQAAVHFRGKSVSIRTGGRVLRARGLSASFNRAMTKLSLPFRSTAYKAERNLRHAEYRFDRHINRLVEDLANKPDKISPSDIYRRLNRIHNEGRSIRRYAAQCGETVDERQIANRLQVNLEESLKAVNKVKPTAAQNLAKLFAADKGRFGNLANDYNAKRQRGHGIDDARYAMRVLGHDRPGPLPPTKKMGEMFAALEQVFDGEARDRERLILTEDSSDENALIVPRRRRPDRERLIMSDDSHDVEELRSVEGDAPTDPSPASLDPSKPIHSPLHELDGSFKTYLQDSLNDQVIKDTRDAGKFKDGVHETLHVDLNRMGYSIDGTTISRSGSNDPMALDKFKSRVAGHRARMLSSLTHQAAFAPFTDHALKAENSPLPFVAGPSGPEHPAPVGWEITSNANGTFDFKAFHQKEISLLAPMKNGEPTAQGNADPSKSLIRYEMSGRLDPENLEQPVKVHSAKLQLNYEPADA